MESRIRPNWDQLVLEVDRAILKLADENRVDMNILRRKYIFSCVDVCNPRIDLPAFEIESPFAEQPEELTACKPHQKICSSSLECGRNAVPSERCMKESSRTVPEVEIEAEEERTLHPVPSSPQACIDVVPVEITLPDQPAPKSPCWVRMLWVESISEFCVHLLKFCEESIVVPEIGGQRAIRKAPSMSLESINPGSLCAVKAKVNFSSRESWVRGRIFKVDGENKMADVFLVDAGRFLASIPFKKLKYLPLVDCQYPAKSYKVSLFGNLLTFVRSLVRSDAEEVIKFFYEKSEFQAAFDADAARKSDEGVVIWPIIELNMLAKDECGKLVVRSIEEHWRAKEAEGAEGVHPNWVSANHGRVNSTRKWHGIEEQKKVDRQQKNMWIQNWLKEQGPSERTVNQGHR